LHESERRESLRVMAIPSSCVSSATATILADAVRPYV
jgi:hypothetical protein